MQPISPPSYKAHTKLLELLTLNSTDSIISGTDRTWPTRHLSHAKNPGSCTPELWMAPFSPLCTLCSLEQHKSSLKALGRTPHSMP